MFHKISTSADGYLKQYTLYRWQLNTQPYSYSWYIALTPVGIDHGSKEDKDFYSAPSSYEMYHKDWSNDHFPPPNGWRSILTPALCNVKVTWALTDQEPPAMSEEDSVMYGRPLASNVVNDDSFDASTTNSDLLNNIPDNLSDDVHDGSVVSSCSDRSSGSDCEGENQIQPGIITHDLLDDDVEMESIG